MDRQPQLMKAAPSGRGRLAERGSGAAWPSFGWRGATANCRRRGRPLPDRADSQGLLGGGTARRVPQAADRCRVACPRPRRPRAPARAIPVQTPGLSGGSGGEGQGGFNDRRMPYECIGTGFDVTGWPSLRPESTTSLWDRRRRRGSSLPAGGGNATPDRRDRSHRPRFGSPPHPAARAQAAPETGSPAAWPAGAPAHTHPGAPAHPPAGLPASAASPTGCPAPPATGEPGRPQAGRPIRRNAGPRTRRRPGAPADLHAQAPGRRRADIRACRGTGGPTRRPARHPVRRRAGDWR
jgi:hypothetical protein